MTALVEATIAKPNEWKIFENASAILWSKELGGEVSRLGRSGQRQYGLDLTGYRDGRAEHLIGIQCKCHEENVTRKKLRQELNSDLDKALAYSDDLKEYYFTTTAPNDTELEKYAEKLTSERLKAGRRIIVRFIGWGNLSAKIQRHPDAIDAFDPSFGPHGKAVRTSLQDTKSTTTEILVAVGKQNQGVEILQEKLDLVLRSLAPQQISDQTSAIATALENYLDQEIDEYRDQIRAGHPKSVLSNLIALKQRLPKDASSRIHFRVEANIGHCFMAMEQRDEAIIHLDEAISYAPEDPKALANSILVETLRGDYDKAVSIATQHLSDPDLLTEEIYGGIASYFLQSFAHTNRSDDPMLFIPSEKRDLLDVEIGHLEYLRTRNARPQWWAVAHALLAKHPDHNHLKRAAAEATIDEISSDALVRSHSVDADTRHKARAASEIFREMYNAVRAREVQGLSDQIALASNYAVALHLAGDPKAALDVLDEGLRLVPDDVALLIRKASIAHETGNRDRTREAYSLLPMEGDAFLLRCQIASAESDWTFLAKLDDRALPQSLPTSDVRQIQTLIRASRVIGNANDDAVRRLSELLAEVADDSRCSIIVAQVARTCGILEVEAQAFANAVRRIGSDSHIADRTMAANDAHRRGSFSTAIKLLFGHVVTDVDNYELRILATCFANVNPPKLEGREFFNALSPIVADITYYRQCEGLYSLKTSDLQRAEAIFRKLVERRPNDLWFLHHLARAIVQQGRAIKEAAFPFPPEGGELDGTAEEHMGFAQLLLHSSAPERALPYAFKTLGRNRDSARANMMYVGLFQSGFDLQIETPTMISDNCWVRLKQKNDEDWSLRIDPTADRPVDSIYAANSVTAQSLIGLKVGDKYSFRYASGAQFDGEIAEIQSHYVGAYRDIVENFNRRFPDETGFVRFSVQDENFDQLLGFLNSRSEAIDTILASYDSGAMPLALIAQQLGRDPISVAELLRKSGRAINACTGNLLEQRRGWSDIHRSKTVVLDLFTLWSVVELGAFDILKMAFRKIAVPISVSAQIAGLDRQEPSSENDDAPPRPESDLGEKGSKTIAEIRSLLHEEIEVLQAFAPVDINEEFGVFLERDWGDCFDPVLLANAENALLLSDDYPLRAAPLSQLRYRTACLWNLFDYARQRGQIGIDRYAQLIVALAKRKYHFLSVNSAVLSYIATRCDEADFRIVADAIGNKTATIVTHIRVVLEFAEAIRAETISENRRHYYFGVLLENLIRFRKDDYAEILSICQRSSDWAFHYITGWRRGHFL